MKLLIAVPVHNERKYAAPVMGKIRSYHSDVLAVDDGSTDGTSDILADMARRGEIHLVRHAQNQGYGQSIIDSFAFAGSQGYDWVITMDCDEQHEPEMIPRFVQEIATDRWDLISGSRYLHPRSDDDLPPGDRRAINASITETLNKLFCWRLTDGFCGFKAHRVSAMRKLNLTETGYAFPLQLWPQVWNAELRVTEIPVRRIYNDATRTFGGTLDDAGSRMKHYQEVLTRELRAIKATHQADSLESGSPSCSKKHESDRRGPVAWAASQIMAVCGCGM